MPDDGIKDAGVQSALRRMVAPAMPVADSAATPTRALRIALTRAAEWAAGLAITALGAADEEITLSDLLARLADDWLLIALDSATGPGVCAFDPALFLAVTEMQTRGDLAQSEPAHRLPTMADAALAEPVVQEFLTRLPELALGTTLEGWPRACTIGARQADRRAIGLILPECSFRAVSLSCWLGVGERQGNFLLALPALLPTDPRDDRAARGARWGQALSQGVLAAPLGLEAVLHHLHLPLSAIGDLAPGQVLALPGVRLAGVRLLTRDKAPVALGRLGQSGGMRAIRIEPAPPHELGHGTVTEAARDPPAPAALDPPDMP